jgi:hypothetical protein
MHHRFQKYCLCSLIFLFALGLTFDSFAHGVDENTRTFLQLNTGIQIIPFLYIGAKHMLTGYDHLLFLVGVLFFVYRSRDVLLFVSLFTLGHSLTLLFGVISDIQVNAYLIDSIIGLSVAYKGFDNLGGFNQVFGKSPNTKLMILIFGLFHGFGLATKLQEFQLHEEGLIVNLIAFNIGVELGQFTALALILLVINFWRKHNSFIQFATCANCLIMSAGFILFGYQLTGYFIS